MSENPYEEIIPALDRMMEIGWVTGHVYSPGKGLVIDWTEKGQQMIGGFWVFLKELATDKGPGSITPTIWKGVVQAATLKFGEI